MHAPFLFIRTHYWLEHIKDGSLSILLKKTNPYTLITTTDQILKIIYHKFQDHIAKLLLFLNEDDFLNINEISNIDPVFAKEYEEFCNSLLPYFNIILKIADIAKQESTSTELKKYYGISYFRYDEISWRTLLHTPNIPKHCDLHFYMNNNETIDPLLLFEWKTYRQGYMYPVYENTPMPTLENTHDEKTNLEVLHPITRAYIKRSNMIIKKISGLQKLGIIKIVEINSLLNELKRILVLMEDIPSTKYQRQKLEYIIKKIEHHNNIL